MWCLFISLRLFECQHLLHKSDLSESGSILTRYDGMVVGEPGRGLVFLSNSSARPQIMNFESVYKHRNMFVHYAPTTTPSYALMNSLLKRHINVNSSFASFKLTTLGPNIELIYDTYNDTSGCFEIPQRDLFVYRTMRGNTTGMSRTVINSDINTELTIFEPFPNFCVIRTQSIPSNVNFSQSEHGIIVTMNVTRGWNEYSFEYRCRFLHWSEYPTNPDRGFVLGPIVVNFGNETVFGNAENLVIPTPDFSMVYNTPILTGFLLSFTAAFVVRMVLIK